MKTALIVLSAAAEKARALVAADRDHRVVLREPFFVGTFRESFRWKGADLPILPFENDKIVIDDGRRFTVKTTAEPYCDGASFFPDKALGVDLAPGYIPHDALYESMADIAADPRWSGAGWTEDAVRALADIVLGKMIARPVGSGKEDRRSFLSRLMYGAVRIFGGIYHRLAVAFAAGALCVWLAGCTGGCMTVPDEGFDPSDDSPVYEVIAHPAAGD